MILSYLMMSSYTVAGTLFQCLASLYVVCVYHLTPDLYCTMTIHFYAIV